MAELTWNSARERYEGEASDGQRIAVEGVEFAEAVADGGDEEELLEVSQWEACIGANQNVYYIDEDGNEIE